MLLDFASGRVLAALEPDRQLEPASLTKMMTAYVTFAELEEGNISLSDQVLISERRGKPGVRRCLSRLTRESASKTS